ncbi:hypothetical protein V6N11_013772 [Hibiscus sabdariffa]|uniref:Uncharacterized protein n=2 Tax=Hibiscus sabdariffa TaxID=183260 RepID=A0ABR2A6F2_9ROSI
MLISTPCPNGLASWFKAKHPEVYVSMEDIINNLAITLCSRATTQLAPFIVVWLPPPIGFLKLNVDGVMLCNGKAGGIGGIIPNSERLTVSSFSKACGPGTPLFAELAALKLV